MTGVGAAIGPHPKKISVKTELQLLPTPTRDDT